MSWRKRDQNSLKSTKSSIFTTLMVGGTTGSSRLIVFDPGAEGRGIARDQTSLYRLEAHRLTFEIEVIRRMLSGRRLKMFESQDSGEPDFSAFHARVFLAV